MQYLIDPVDVSHERLHDEVIVINLASGAYYSGSGTAADLWTLISGGASIDQTVALLAATYRTDKARVQLETKACVNMLRDRNIIHESDSVISTDNVPKLPVVDRLAWAAPVFDEYTDMWDLLEADPIHDVGEAGWPYAIPQPKTA